MMLDSLSPAKVLKVLRVSSGHHRLDSNYYMSQHVRSLDRIHRMYCARGAAEVCCYICAIVPGLRRVLHSSTLVAHYSLYVRSHQQANMQTEESGSAKFGPRRELKNIQACL